MARQWILTGQEGFETSLQYNDNAPIPSADQLGPNEVLVRIHAASLNKRDVDIASPNSIGGRIEPPLVPACDGAGIVEAVGSSVKEFAPGDRVVTNLCDVSDDNYHYSMADAASMLGIGPNGTLCTMGVFGAGALVHAPSSLNWLQASTLTVTWLTAWNALLGLEGSKAGPGKQVLIQGTGGVSVAALQLAVALGAEVVATTSSSERAAKLKALGAKHVINYRDTPDWGKEARSLTPGGEGFDIIIDVGGNETLGQSLAAVQTGGLVNVIGAVGGQAETVPLLGALISTCIVRGILAGSRSQFNDVVRFIDEKKLKPAIDDVVFELEDAKEAYRRLSEKKHFAKVVIRIDH